MAYLPGVPDMGPAPVSPVAAGAKTPIGAPKGISAIAHSVGKPGRSQSLGSVVGRTGKGLTSIGGGSSDAHAFNHYGKKAPALLGGSQISGGVDPTAHAGAKVVRGGNMRSHLRTGGLATSAPVGEDSE